METFQPLWCCVVVSMALVFVAQVFRRSAADFSRSVERGTSTVVVAAADVISALKPAARVHARDGMGELATKVEAHGRHVGEGLKAHGHNVGEGMGKFGRCLLAGMALVAGAMMGRRQ